MLAIVGTEQRGAEGWPTRKGGLYFWRLSFIIYIGNSKRELKHGGWKYGRKRKNVQDGPGELQQWYNFLDEIPEDLSVG